MKIRLSYARFLVLIYFAAIAGRAQVNLVPNPGFEQGTCPTFMTQWNYCTGWSNCNGNTGSGLWGTPDYYNTCGTVQSPYNPVPPNTGMGYCNTHTGNCMMGIVEYDQPFNSYREYISTQLSCPMLAGYTYTVSFWETASSAPSVKYNSSHLGVYLSATQPVQSGYNCINVTPQFEITSVVSNTSWVQHTFTITPVSTLNYITLGCFRTDAQITTVLQTPGASQPYSNYFIDDIAVYGPPTSTVSFNSASTNAACFNTTGSATISPSAPGTYSYSWSPGGYTTATVNNLAAGIYTVYVSDASCNSALTTVTVSAPPAISSTVSSVTNAGCFGSATGAASVAASGGTGAYTYSWIPSGGTGPSASGLTAGSYTLAIHDANNCLKNQTVVVTQPAAINTSATHTNVLCNGNASGAASVTASGGAGSFSYSWTPGGASTSSITGSTAGNYTCTITDGNGCSKTQTVNITEPAVLSASIASAGILCYNNTATASVSASGGTGSYTYSWMPTGTTTYSISGLTAGSYTCIVKDANGCAKTQTLGITQPTAITASVNNTGASCFGSTNGSATITATGGTGALTYSWMPNGGNASMATGLAAGNYTFTIKDANGCTSSGTTSISQPSALGATLTASPASVCNSLTPVAMSDAAAGGTMPYTYQWSSGQTTSSISVTPAVSSVYSCTLTDAHGCTATRTVAISVGTNNAAYTYTLRPCSDSLVFTNTTAGPGPYQWAFGDGQSSPLASPGTHVYASDGTYTVSLIAGAGTACADTITQVISIQNVHPVASFNYTFSPCNGVATFTSGTQNASAISWNLGNGSTSSQPTVATTYASGTYTVSLTAVSSTGCRDTAYQNITIPLASINAGFGYSSSGCDSTVFINNSTGATSYHWIFDNGDTSNVAAPQLSLSQGIHTVTLTVSNGTCSASAVKSIDIEPSAPANPGHIPNVFTPNGDGVNDVLDFSPYYNCGSFQFEIFDRWGLSIIKSSQTKSNAWDGRTTSGMPVPDGTYFYILTGQAGNTLRGSVTLFR